MDSAQVIENLAKGVEHIKELENSHTEDFSQEMEVLKAKIMDRDRSGVATMTNQIFGILCFR